MLVILIALAVLIVVDLVALRWGADSREGATGSPMEQRVDWRSVSA